MEEIVIKRSVKNMIFKPEWKQASWDYLTNLEEAVISKSSVEYIKKI